jgi:hypothetical protein
VSGQKGFKVVLTGELECDGENSHQNASQRFHGSITVFQTGFENGPAVGESDGLAYWNRDS